MIIETGRVVSVESGAVWVETIQKSACSSCKAESTCGQRLMSKWDGHTTFLRVVDKRIQPNSYQVGDEVTLGIPERIVANGALWVYLMPLITMMIGVCLSHYVGLAEGWTILSAFVGLGIGGAVVRLHSYIHRNNPDFNPVIVDRLGCVEVGVGVVDNGVHHAI